MTNEQHYKEQLAKLYSGMSKPEKMYKNNLPLKERVQDNGGVSRNGRTERKDLAQGKMITHNPVSQYDEKMNLIKKWDFLGDAARELGFIASRIINACKSKGKCGGYYFRY